MLRFVFKFVLAFLGLLAIAIFIFFFAFNLNDYKIYAEKQASDYIQDELKINGDIKLGMEGFHPSIIFNDVKLGKEGKTTVTMADRLEFEIPFQKPSKDNPLSIFANMKNIRIDGRPLGDYDMPVKISENGIEIPELKGELGDAQAKGMFSFLDGKLAVKLDVHDLDYSEFADGTQGGKTKVAIDLNARGKSGDAIISTLNGTMTLAGGEGSIAGKAIGFWAGDLFLNMLKSKKGDTKVICSLADFDVQNGVAITKVLVIDTDEATIFGKGTIDFVNGYVNMRFKPEPKNPSLLSMATPVTVKGPFGDVTAAPETIAVLEKIGGLVLSTVNPAAAAIMLSKLNLPKDSPCAAHLEGAK